MTKEAKKTTTKEAKKTTVEVIVDGVQINNAQQEEGAIVAVSEADLKVLTKNKQVKSAK